MRQKTIDGIPQRNVSIAYGKTVHAYIGESLGYRFFLPGGGEDIQVIVTARDKKELTRFFKAIGVEVDIGLSMQTATMSQTQTNFQVPSYPAIPQKIPTVAGAYAVLASEEGEDW